jgi:hemerythrin superfamily protein
MMMQKASIDRDGRKLSPLMAFLGGTMAALFASRVLPPMVAQITGASRDPFEALAADHRKVLAALDRLIGLGDQRLAQRGLMLLKVKRSLTAHALAEEDVVYPALKLQAEADEDARQLYAEHADIKTYLCRLETLLKDGPAFREIAGELRELVARHAHQEETVDFPKLRERLDAAAIATMGGSVSREKAMVL